MIFATPTCPAGEARWNVYDLSRDLWRATFVRRIDHADDVKEGCADGFVYHAWFHVLLASCPGGLCVVGLDEGAHDLGIVAAVVCCVEEEAALLGECKEGGHVRRLAAERLLREDVLARLERRLDGRAVRRRGRRDDHAGHGVVGAHQLEIRRGGGRRLRADRGVDIDEPADLDVVALRQHIEVDLAGTAHLAGRK